MIRSETVQIEPSSARAVLISAVEIHCSIEALKRYHRDESQPTVHVHRYLILCVISVAIWL